MGNAVTGLEGQNEHQPAPGQAERALSFALERVASFSRGAQTPLLGELCFQGRSAWAGVAIQEPKK